MIQLQPPVRIRAFDSRNEEATLVTGHAIAVAYYQGGGDDLSAFALLVIVDAQEGALAQFREVVVPLVGGFAPTLVTAWRVELLDPWPVDYAAELARALEVKAQPDIPGPEPVR